MFLYSCDCIVVSILCCGCDNLGLNFGYGSGCVVVVMVG